MTLVRQAVGMVLILVTRFDRQGRLSGVIRDPSGGRREPFSGSEQLVDLVSAMTSANPEQRDGLAQLDGVSTAVDRGGKE